jgi:hypothetical protein
LTRSSNFAATTLTRAGIGEVYAERGRRGEFCVTPYSPLRYPEDHSAEGRRFRGTCCNIIQDVLRQGKSGVGR